MLYKMVCPDAQTREELVERLTQRTLPENPRRATSPARDEFWLRVTALCASPEQASSLLAGICAMAPAPLVPVLRLHASEVDTTRHCGIHLTSDIPRQAGRAVLR